MQDAGKQAKCVATAVERASCEVLDQVYAALLHLCPLSEEHREDLLARGLKASEIKSGRYGTLPLPGQRAGLFQKVLAECPKVDLKTVPGFVRRNGRPKVLGWPGLLVPSCNWQSQIVAIKIRSKDGANRYTSLSSNTREDGGPSPGAVVHVPPGIRGKHDTVRVTEGELKADVAWHRTNLATISIPGVSAWLKAFEVLASLGARKIHLAFDSDARRKKTVAAPLGDFAKALKAAGFDLRLEQWDTKYKGIDDALVAGQPISDIAGDEAWNAITDIISSAGCVPPTPPSQLDRLPEVLQGGADALYGDDALLAALAMLSNADFEKLLPTIEDAGVKRKSIERILTPLRSTLMFEAIKTPGYRIIDDCICRYESNREGRSGWVELGNFSAKIVETVASDDGIDSASFFSITGRAKGRAADLDSIKVAAAEFDSMQWVTTKWGGEAYLHAGNSNRDHMRAAIHSFSRERERRIEYGYIGWKKFPEGHWGYLHADGVIGSVGELGGVTVKLAGKLQGFSLPAPPTGQELCSAIRNSFDLLNVAPHRVILPLLAAVFRAPLGQADLSVFLCGPTGQQKSELAALMQQFWGKSMDRKNLPGNFQSTSNSLEASAFAANNALFVVDDFAPCGNTGDVQRSHKEADRIFRNQGNAAGRGRCRADGSLKEPKPPRCLYLGTGEDVPRGQSLRARMFIVESGTGQVRLDRLSVAQKRAAEGHFASVMAGYLQWLAPDYGNRRQRMVDEENAIRDQVMGEGKHARTPTTVAMLLLGWRTFLAFAVERGALTPAEREQFDRLGSETLVSIGDAQAEHAMADHCDRFLDLLTAVLRSKVAHLEAVGGGHPEDLDANGWEHDRSGHCLAKGPQIGWIDETGLYVQPDAAFTACQRMATEQGDPIPIGKETLWKRLKDRGLLQSFGEKRNTIRKSFGSGQRTRVLHLAPDYLIAPEVGQVGQVGQDSEKHGGNGPVNWPTFEDGPQKVGQGVGHGPNGEGPPGPLGPPCPELVGQEMGPKTQGKSTIGPLGPLGPLFGAIGGAGGAKNRLRQDLAEVFGQDPDSVILDGMHPESANGVAK